MDEWLIEPLDSSHQRGEFSCGKGPLDNFLRALVSQYEKRKLGRTYVAVRLREKRVYGYYTLASGTVAFQNLPAVAAKKLPKHPVPVMWRPSMRRPGISIGNTASLLCKITTCTCTCRWPPWRMLIGSVARAKESDCPATGHRLHMYCSPKPKPCFWSRRPIFYTRSQA